MAISRWQKRQLLYDKLHKGFVNCCVAVTIVAATFTVYRVYDFLTNVRPETRKHQRFLQQELLKEGQYVEEK